MIDIAREFLKIECAECGNEQNIFSHASTEVDCLVCGEIIASPTGGKAEVSGEVVQELDPE